MEKEENGNGRQTKESSGVSGGSLVGFGAIALFGLGLWKLLDYFSDKDERKQELIDEYTRELIELLATIEQMYDEEGMTDEYEALIHSMSHGLYVKELAIQSYNTSWVTDIKDAAVETAKSFGYIVVPAAIGGYITFKIIQYIFRKRGGGDGQPPTCSSCGLTFTTVDELATHVEREHPANDSAADVQAAQAMYSAQKFWVQETIAAGSGTYTKAHQDWTTLTSQERIYIAAAMMVMAVVLINPALGYSAALLLI